MKNRELEIIELLVSGHQAKQAYSFIGEDARIIQDLTTNGLVASAAVTIVSGSGGYLLSAEQIATIYPLTELGKTTYPDSAKSWLETKIKQILAQF